MASAHANCVAASCSCTYNDGVHISLFPKDANLKWEKMGWTGSKDNGQVGAHCDHSGVMQQAVGR